MPGHRDGVDVRAREIGEFLGVPPEAASERLSRGFHYNHALVAQDFRRELPRSEEALLRWYRDTDAYIWELSAYHLEEGFNYPGMCEGIGASLPSGSMVLCLGDGIGDLTIALEGTGHRATYHDLQSSKTAEFAAFRFRKHGYSVNTLLTSTFQPGGMGGVLFDAVVALDFLEHMPDVAAWTWYAYSVLKPGGRFLAQNAFGCGSGEEGSIPMHLASNDHWVQDWGPLCQDIGFVQEFGGWWRKGSRIR